MGSGKDQSVAPQAPPKLGDMVKDKISGFKGVVVAEINSLWGTRRLKVQPNLVNGKVSADRVAPAATFDEGRLYVVNRNAVSKDRDFEGEVR